MTIRCFMNALAALLLLTAVVTGEEILPQAETTPANPNAAVEASPAEGQPSFEDVYRRLDSVQAELETLRSQTGRPGLQEGARRPSDAPLVEDARRTPAFPKVQLTGFFQADAGFFGQNAASMAQFGDIQDASGFRRARLAAFGDLATNVHFMLEMDFAQAGRPSFQDVWLDIHNIALLGNVTVGHWRQPFGMNNLTSSREQQFMELSLPFAFAPFRQLGIGFHNTSASQNVTWAFSGFRYPDDAFGGVGNPIGAVGPPFGDRGYGVAGRMTAVPIYDECGFLLHLGADYSWLTPATDNVRFRNTPEFSGPFVGNQGTIAGALGNLNTVPFFVDTGTLATRNVSLYCAELGARLGSWYAQSEATYAVVQPLGGGASQHFSGAYAQMGYFLTGEVRPYNRQGGVFGRVKPLYDFGVEGWGALEVAVRYSYLDLNAAGVSGGRLNDVTFGTNWHLNQYTKFQLNYIHAFLDRTPVGRSDTNIVALRAQVDF